MPNTYVNKVTANGQILIDLTADTALAADVAQGKYFHLATGERVAGTASGGGGDGYILTTVCPQQTITPNSDRVAYPVGSFDYEVGEFYLVTFDGVEYVTSCALCWETNHVIGDTRVIWGDAVTVAPFCAITTSVTDKEVYCRDTNTHTIKVEHLELVSPTVLTTKTITSNGTYSASDDSANGFSSVNVAVPSSGGASNFVMGEFVADSETGAAHTITIPYTGTGYPIAAMVFIADGAYESGTTWYMAIQRYAVGQWTYSKSVQDTAPTWTSSGTENQGVTTWVFKNSTSSASSYSRSSAMSTNVLTSSSTNAANAGSTCVRFKGNGKTLSYYTASSSYGLLAGETYKYIIVYSS